MAGNLGATGGGPFGAPPGRPYRPRSRGGGGAPVELSGSPDLSVPAVGSRRGPRTVVARGVLVGDHLRDELDRLTTCQAAAMPRLEAITR